MDNNMLDYCLKCLLYILLHSVDIGRDIGFSGEREKKHRHAQLTLSLCLVYIEYTSQRM